VAEDFDRELFDEAVLYIAWRMRDDPRFGRTKIAKTMFYADFTAYAEEGKPLTGARYFHWPKGPFTPELYRTEERLVARGVASLKEPEFEGDEAKLRAESFAPACMTPPCGSPHDSSRRRARPSRPGAPATPQRGAHL
jgi:hypothetical protein